MDTSLKGMMARRKAAQGEKDQFMAMMDEVYEYVLPYCKSANRTGKGEKRTNRIYDHTAIVSAYRGANRLAQDLSPPGRVSVELKVGPLAMLRMDEDQQKEFAQVLEQIHTVTGIHFVTGEWDSALAEMCLHVEAGTGAMLIVPDTKRQVARFVTASMDAIMLSADGFNEINGIYWCKRWSLQGLADEFGEDAAKKWPKDLQDKLATKPETEIELYQDTVFDVKKMRWVRVAWSKDCKNDNGTEGYEFDRSESRTCPWITPRFFKVPDETYGRGPITIAMPTVKAVNTAVKLNLQAAAIAMLGIYTAIDDGVFNPSNAPITPGAFWKVARNGGALGPSISKLPDPRIDLSQIVIKEFRMAIQEAMNDQQLPPDSAAVKSATEILERVKRAASDHMGAYGRLVTEIMVAAYKRVMECAYELKQLPETVDIDRLFVDVQVSSPLALAREAEKWQKVTQWIEALVMLLQAKMTTPGLERFAHMDVVLPEMARGMAIPERYLPSAAERQKMDETAQVMGAGGGEVSMQVAA